MAATYVGAPCRKFGHTLRYRKDGGCVECRSARSKAWLNKNPVWRRENQRLRRSKNRAAYREYSKKWRAKNPGGQRAATMLHFAKVRFALPPWVTNEDRLQMRAKYEEAARLSRETGIRHSVDHEIPMGGETVCGLHVPDNLVVITLQANFEKNNSLILDDTAAASVAEASAARQLDIFIDQGVSCPGVPIQRLAGEMLALSR
jgi:hypothetical protein